jgi:undecaprenyl diphosphate synthase
MDGTAPITDRAAPAHVAIIMDGNGRWATARGLGRPFGHRKGVDAVRPIVEAAAEAGVSYLTLFAFSAENWTRPVGEVDELMRLLRFYLRSQIAELHKNGVKMRVIGDRSRLSADIVAMIERGEALTRENTKITLAVALNYGGRQDIVQAARALAEQARAGSLDPASIDETVFGNTLHTAGLPDPDLLIRTSGEQRISNFLLWQFAYTEMVFVETLWPDFTPAEFQSALREYQTRDRRFGATISAR